MGAMNTVSDQLYNTNSNLYTTLPTIYNTRYSYTAIIHIHRQDIIYNNHNQIKHKHKTQTDIKMLKSIQSITKIIQTKSSLHLYTYTGVRHQTSLCNGILQYYVSNEGQKNGKNYGKFNNNNNNNKDKVRSNSHSNSNGNSHSNSNGNSHSYSNGDRDRQKYGNNYNGSGGNHNGNNVGDNANKRDNGEQAQYHGKGKQMDGINKQALGALERQRNTTKQYKQNEQIQQMQESLQNSDQHINTKKQKGRSDRFQSAFTYNDQHNISFNNRSHHTSQYQHRFQPEPPKVTTPPQNGYGYYNWQDPKTLESVLSQRYYLNDIILGFRYLKSLSLTLSQYTQTHLLFMLHLTILYPVYEKQVMEIFIPIFLYRQEDQAELHKECEYIKYAKILCVEKYKRDDKYAKDYEWVGVIDRILRQRVELQHNCKDMQSMLKSLSCNCYEFMGGLLNVFNRYKKLLFIELHNSSYNPTNTQIRIIIQIYQKLLLFDQNLKYEQLLTQIPQQILHNKQYLINTLKFLQQFLNFNTSLFINDNDLIEFNYKFNKCQEKFINDRQVRKEFRNYSEFLVLIGKIQCVNFHDMLDQL